MARRSLRHPVGSPGGAYSTTYVRRMSFSGRKQPPIHSRKCRRGGAGGACGARRSSARETYRLYIVRDRRRSFGACECVCRGDGAFASPFGSSRRKLLSCTNDNVNRRCMTNYGRMLSFLGSQKWVEKFLGIHLWRCKIRDVESLVMFCKNLV